MAQNNYFLEVAAESGITITNDENAIVLAKEQALIVRDINRILQNHISYSDNAQEIITGLKDLCEDENFFRRALMPTILNKSRNTSTQENLENNKVLQDSIFRILLTVDCLQTDIIEMLTDCIKIEATKQTENTSWLRILLNPLKYLPFISNEKKLTEKIIEALEKGHYTSQLEIINVIPDIIPDSEHGTIAVILCDLIESNPNITTSSVDCLNSLELSNDTKLRIQDNVLTIITTNPSAETFSVLFEFLVSDCTAQKLMNVILKIRNVLDTIMKLENDKESVQSSKALIMNHLKSQMLISKPLREAVTQVINSIKVHTDHKPVDLLLLIILFCTGKNSKTIVEGILRKKIKGGFFRTTLLEKLLDNYFIPETLKEFLDIILEISTGLLQNQKEESMSNFTTALYNLLFNHKYIEKVQRQDIINSLVLLGGTSGQKYVSSVLNILMTLSENHSLLQQHTLQLMNLLELLDAMDLKDVSKLFDLLCSLTCGENISGSFAGFKDELHILVRKQLSSNKKKVKNQGIVSAIMMVKHIATTTTDQSEITIYDSEKSLNVSDLPSGVPQEAARLLELTNTSTLNNPDYLGLFYDQLALFMITTSSLEKHFLEWLRESTTNDFKKIYVTHSTPKPLNDIPLSEQYCLQDREEVRSPLAINIAELSIKHTYTSIKTLSSLFRLVRLLQADDIESIDGLLGCGVIMPDVEDINEYDTHQIKLIIDCLFHCINWFREVVSAFVKQKNKKIRKRVLERVNQIIELEEKLQEYLSLVPDHILPKSYFDSFQENHHHEKVHGKIKQPPKKKQKTSPTTQNLDDTAASSSTRVNLKNAKSSAAKKTNKKQSPTKINRINFRDLDTDVMILLRYSLKFDEFNISNHTSSLTQQTCLSIKQFNFLLRDVVEKSLALTKQTVSDLSHFKVVSIEHFVTDCIKIFPYIMKNLKTIAIAISQTIDQCDQILDSPDMFSSTTKDLRLSFGSVLELVSIILSWSGFQNSKNNTLLNDCLLSLNKDTSETETDQLAIELSRFFSKYLKQCLCLSSAVHLVKIVQALYCINPDATIKKKCAAISERLLMKKWYTLNGHKESGMMANIHLDILIKSYLYGIDVGTLCGFVGNLEDEVAELNATDDNLSVLQSIQKGNFFILFRGICAALLEGVKNEVVSLTNNEHLTLWKNTALTMQYLITIVKIQENKLNVNNFVKKSIAILKLFLSHGIPILEIMLRSKPDEVLDIFKIIQRTTRFLHYICCTSKITKNLSLVSYVPQFRLTLESLLVRVKAALVANNCESAFMMGTLKNRNLQGDDILSQNSITSEKSNADQAEPEDEIPPEESDESITEHEENGSVSDIY